METAGDMRAGMLKIGAFSKLSRVPVKTLRYYDEIKLLVPEEVDPFTGSRRYALEQGREVFAQVAVQ